MRSTLSALTIALSFALLASAAPVGAEESKSDRWLDAAAARFEALRDEAGKKADKSRVTLRKAEDLAAKATVAGNTAARETARKAAATARAAMRKAESQRDRAAEMAAAIKSRITALAQGIGTRPAAVAISHKGSVEIRQGGQWLRVPEGEPIIAEPGTPIRTGADGYVTLQLSNRPGTVRVGPNSELTLPEGPSPLELLLGKIKLEVVKLSKAENFQVRTPAAAMAVRGTAFRIAHPENGSTTVTVTEGSVEVSRPDGEDSVLVAAGQQVTVAPGHSPAHPVEIPAENKGDEWEEEKEE
ncbi:MAG: FecR domain-containing protein [Desulfuromonadales bacterium]|nr:FecR domain-containing protein [Desulfuromonadales bacterium]